MSEIIFSISGTGIIVCMIIAIFDRWRFAQWQKERRHLWLAKAQEYARSQSAKRDVE